MAAPTKAAVVLLLLTVLSEVCLCTFVGKLSKKNEFSMVYQLKET